MVLVSFSEPVHVQKIVDGSKRQTTRQPRKSPIKEGDSARLYYRVRMKPCCQNCINPECPYAVQGELECDYAKTGLKRFACDQHINFFGNAKITSVKTILFTEMPYLWKAAWALSDGFESWEQADKWFSEHNGPHWTSFPWVVITWEPMGIQEAVQ